MSAQLSSVVATVVVELLEITEVATVLVASVDDGAGVGLG